MLFTRSFVAKRCAKCAHTLYSVFFFSLSLSLSVSALHWSISSNHAISVVIVVVGAAIFPLDLFSI